MSMEQRFFICKHCGNIVAMVKSSGVPIMCCGEKMSEIVPGTMDASKEKHVPVYTIEGNTVNVAVGSVLHPMQPEHYIEWVSLQTRSGNQRKQLLTHLVRIFAVLHPSGPPFPLFDFNDTRTKRTKRTTFCAA